MILKNRPIERTLWRGTIQSERSLCLRTETPKNPEDLIDVFGLDPHTFPSKFDMAAIAGDGQEYRRIRTFHSSSLISLLCFYGVSETNPLTLRLEGKEITFTKSCFEVKNHIGEDEKGHPHDSNMDVLLFGENTTTKKNVLFFLESKFSEYLFWGKHSDISYYVYGKTYAQLFNGNYLDRMGLKYENNLNTPGYFDLMSIKGQTKHYAGGIKQMISHFLGVQNVSENKQYSGYDIYLGEILYRFPDQIDRGGEKFNDYTNLYKILAEGLNDISNSKFKVLKNCLTYQDVFKDFKLDQTVKIFYSI